MYLPTCNRKHRDVAHAKLRSITTFPSLATQHFISKLSFRARRDPIAPLPRLQLPDVCQCRCIDPKWLAASLDEHGLDGAIRCLSTVDEIEPRMI